MPVDSATTIAALNTALPTAADPKSEGDDNFRHIKTVLKAAFPNVAGPVAASDVELSYVDGVTSSIQGQLDAKAGTASPAFSGTPTVPTATGGTSTTQAASTAFVQAAIATVNTQTATVLTLDASTSIAAAAGQHVVCTNAALTTITLPASPTAGQTVWVTVGNGRTDNVIARNGQNIMSLAEDMTLDSANVTAQLRFINSTLGWRLV
jgi:hypothetical protein